MLDINKSVYFQGGYMAAKKAKLQDQFMIDAAKEASNDNSRIFDGVSIFVNGYSGKNVFFILLK